MPDDYLASLSADARETMWHEAIVAQQPELLVARVEGSVVGWVSFGASRDDGAAASVGEVWAIYLDPGHVSTGAGRALWLCARERLIERGFASAMLWVLTGNARAIRFYERAGFTLDAGSAKSFKINGREIKEQRYSTPL